MTRRLAMKAAMASLVGGLALEARRPASAQMGPGMMRGQGMMGGQGQGGMPMQQMAGVMALMADRLAAGKPLSSEKAQQLRRLAEQVASATEQMTEGMGGMMGGGMMGGGTMQQGSERMGELSRLLAEMADLLRGA